MNYKYSLSYWVRYDTNGVLVPGSLIARPFGVKPVGKNWYMIPGSACCPCECIITFRNNSANTGIRSIVSTDGRFSFGSTITNGGQKSFIIPNCYDMEFTLGLSTPSADIIAVGTTAQGDGVVTVDPDTTIVSGTTTPSIVVNTTAVCGSEYLIIIQDD